MKTVMVVVADGVVEERNDALTASPIGTKRQVPGPCRQCFPSRRFPADEGPAIATHLRRHEGERGGEGGRKREESRNSVYKWAEKYFNRYWVDGYLAMQRR